MAILVSKMGPKLDFGQEGRDMQAGPQRNPELHPAHFLPLHGTPDQVERCNAPCSARISFAISDKKLVQG
jgi:hypothetical protein